MINVFVLILKAFPNGRRLFTFMHSSSGTPGWMDGWMDGCARHPDWTLVTQTTR